RLAGTVFRKPARTAGPVLIVLLLVASPILGIDFALPNQKTLPTSAQSRQVADTIEADFPAQSHAEIPVILDGPADPATAQRYALQLSSIDGVASVSAPGMTAVHGAAGPASPAAGVMSADGWQ